MEVTERPTAAPNGSRMPAGRRALIAVAALLLACVAALFAYLVWIDRPPPSHYTWRQLDRLPEATLFYPGCQVDGRGGANASQDFGGYNPANVSFDCATAADGRTLRAWYDAELTARGWLPSDADTDTYGCCLEWFGWRNGELHFRVWLRDDSLFPPRRLFREFRAAWCIGAKSGGQ